MSRRLAAAVASILLAAACLGGNQTAWLGKPEIVSPGVEFYWTADQTLVNREGAIAVYLLRLDLNRVKIESALSNDEVVDAERVDGIARRHQAIAAVNAGFFNVKNGEPVSVLKVGGELVSDNAVPRGAVAVHTRPGARQELFFDQAAVKVRARFAAGGQPVAVDIDGVDTTRERGRLMMYTPKYHVDTDTAANGTEWALGGSPLAVTDVRRDLGKTPIPRDGAVLSYGGLDPPPPLDGLAPGTVVTFQTAWRLLNGTPVERFDEAQDVINGAGLLRRNGVDLANWQASESLQPSTFTDVRHPRTLIGVDRRGSVWLVAVDGRQPDYSIGMTFQELLRLCRRLDLSNALNLDGGGSTTMVVKGEIVNRPSDAAGPRSVSDAILVSVR
jgi:exopolysaccharide biosynthesis protein